VVYIITWMTLLNPNNLINYLEVDQLIRKNFIYFVLLFASLVLLRYAPASSSGLPHTRSKLLSGEGFFIISDAKCQPYMVYYYCDIASLSTEIQPDLFFSTLTFAHLHLCYSSYGDMILFYPSKDCDMKPKGV
jgi:hypothetical protein